jgi:hypothetical protein
MKYKPEGLDQRGSSTKPGSSSQAAITSQLQMSLDEAHLILNVKKEESMETIIRVSISFLFLPSPYLPLFAFTEEDVCACVCVELRDDIRCE